MDRRAGWALAPLLACTAENPLFMLGSGEGEGGGTTGSAAASTAAVTSATSGVSTEGSGGGTMTGSATGSGEPVTGGSATGESATTCPEGQDSCGPPVDPCVGGDACTGAADWLVRSGDAWIQRGSDAAMLDDGGVAVVGSFAGQLGEGGQVIGAETEPTFGDGYLLRYDDSGALLWSRQFGGANLQWVTTVAGMPGGAIGFGGTFIGQLAINDQLIQKPGASSGFVGAFDVNGGLMWLNNFGDNAYVRDLAATGDGGLVVVGDFIGVLILGGDMYQSADLDPFAVRFGVDGKLLWSVAPHGVGADGARGVAVGPDDSTTVTGSFSAALDLGGATLASQGKTDVYVARFGPDGAHVASAGFGGPEQDFGLAAASGPDGRLVIAGVHGAGFDLGAGVFPAAMDGFDAFFAVFEPDGALAWAHGGVRGATFDLGVGIDGLGRVTVLLSSAGMVETDLGGGPMPASPGVYLAKYAADGTLAWAHLLAKNVALFGHGLDVDAGGRIAVSGAFSGSLMYPEFDTLNSAGEFDVFAGRFQP